MGRMPEDVMQRELDMTWQDIFTYASWAIALAMLVMAFVLARRHGTWFFPLVVIAAGLSAFAEPLYDVAFDLWFYDVHNGEPGAAYAHFTAFGVVQPIWTHSGYMILYAGPALYAGWRMYQGNVTAKLLFLIWGVEIATSCVFEVIGTGVDVFTYYGPYEMRIWNYPFVIGVLEGTQTVLFTVLAVNLWRRIKTGWGMTGLLAVHPVTMYAANFGLGAPLIIALHLDDPRSSSALVWVATFMVYGLCTLAILAASRFLPGPLDEPDEAVLEAPLSSPREVITA
jgi:hypothetical protein